MCAVETTRISTPSREVGCRRPGLRRRHDVEACGVPPANWQPATTEVAGLDYVNEGGFAKTQYFAQGLAPGVPATQSPPRTCLMSLDSARWCESADGALNGALISITRKLVAVDRHSALAFDSARNGCAVSRQTGNENRQGPTSRRHSPHVASGTWEVGASSGLGRPAFRHLRCHGGNYDFTLACKRYAKRHKKFWIQLIFP